MQGTAGKEAAFVPVYVKNVNAIKFRGLSAGPKAFRGEKTGFSYYPEKKGYFFP
jgi:hypothetical protein